MVPPAPPVPDAQISPGKVIAEFSFGFWWSIFASTNNRALWQPCLQHAFPNYRLRALHTDLDKIRGLRNRISHHEPIHHWDLVGKYQELVRITEKINPALAWWIDSTSSVAALLDRKP